MIHVSSKGSDQNNGSSAYPFLTLARAQQEARLRSKNLDSDLIVHIGAGTYYLNQTLKFEPQDSGTNGFSVIYKGDGFSRTTLSGGNKHALSWSSVGGGIFKTTVNAPAGFRQLYINGKRATRARNPNIGSLRALESNHWISCTQTSDTWNCPNLRVATDANMTSTVQDFSGMEIVLLQTWHEAIVRVGSSQMVNGMMELTPQVPEKDRLLKIFNPSISSAYYLQNSREFLDRPGEWYFNIATSELFYMPLVGEDLSTAEVITPALEQIIDIAGNQNEKVRNLKFEDITFTHSSWERPSSSGYVENQAGQYFWSPYSATIPGAFRVQDAEKIEVSYNRFTHLGGVGLEFHSAVKQSKIIGNVFYDISASAIDLENSRVVPFYFGLKPRMISAVDVTNNYITEIGVDFPGSVGIFAGYVHDVKISHNEISTVPYSGISLGWGWASQQTSASNNTISFNRICRTTRTMIDGGAIYTLGRMDGTIISNNFIHDLFKEPLWGKRPVSDGVGIYLDQGSAFITVRDNTIQNAYEFLSNNTNDVLGNTDPANTNIWSGNTSDNSKLTGTEGLEPAFAHIKDGLDTESSPCVAPIPPVSVLRPPRSPQLLMSLDATRFSGNTALNDGALKTLNGVASGSLNFVSSPMGGGLHFDGITSQVSVPHSAAMESDKFTFSLWFNPDVFNPPADSRIWIGGKNLHERTAGYYVLMLAGGTLPRLFAQINFGPDANYEYDFAEIKGRTVVTTGAWHMATITYDGIWMNLYLDGVLENIRYVGLPRTTGTGAFVFGQRPDGFRLFKGSIDEVVYYDRDLSAAEIVEIFKGNYTGPAL